MSDGTGELEELTADECWRLLARQTVGRLAVSVNNKPDIFPVNHRVDDDTIVIRTAAGMKLAAATLATAVAYEVDDIDEMRHTGSSVVIRGQAIEIENLDELMEADGLKVEPWAGGSKNRYLRIVPSHVSGRRISAH
ncbi:MAG: pyridoxamine 5'-phosphate oxidase family protein [Acidimicrobiales bacterium]